MSTDWNAIEEWFYLDGNAETIGPFTTPEIIEFYKDGGITDETYIWCEECEGYVVGSRTGLPRERERERERRAF
jgi:hypothetical protein